MLRLASPNLCHPRPKGLFLQRSVRDPQPVSCGGGNPPCPPAAPSSPCHRLGRLDDEGFLRVTGRRKELLALSTRKSLAPLPVEARLLQHPWISQAVLVGEERTFVSVLLVLSRPVVEAGARRESLPEAGRGLLQHQHVRAKVDEAVARVNRDLSRTEQVRRYHILDRSGRDPEREGVR